MTPAQATLCSHELEVPVLIALLLSSVSSAQEFVTQVGEPQVFEQGGVWSRPIPLEGGWKLGLATGNDFWVADLYAGEAFGEWTLDRDSKVNLTNLGNLKDNAIKRCPDGTYLLGHSADLESGQDSSYFTWVDAEFGLLSQGPVEEANPDRGHNDLALLCNHLVQGVGHLDFSYPSPNTSVFFGLDIDDGPVSETFLLDFRAEGAGMRADTRDDTIVGVSADHMGNAYAVVWDAEWNEVARHSNLDLVDDGNLPYWPQGLMRLGEYWLVATMGAPGGQMGAGTGDVFVSVLDSGFNTLETRNVTGFLPGVGVSRPWIDRKGSQALVGFDREVRHGVVELTLDLAAFGIDPDADDTGGGDPWSSEGGDDTADDDEDDDEKGCGGCAGAPAPAGLAALFMGAVGWLRRRERVQTR